MRPFDQGFRAGNRVARRTQKGADFGVESDRLATVAAMFQPVRVAERRAAFVARTGAGIFRERTASAGLLCHHGILFRTPGGGMRISWVQPAFSAPILLNPFGHRLAILRARKGSARRESGPSHNRLFGNPGHPRRNCFCWRQQGTRRARISRIRAAALGRRTAAHPAETALFGCNNMVHCNYLV
jgi:hypothetical protein